MQKTTLTAHLLPLSLSNSGTTLMLPLEDQEKQQKTVSALICAVSYQEVGFLFLAVGGRRTCKQYSRKSPWAILSQLDQQGSENQCFFNPHNARDTHPRQHWRPPGPHLGCVQCSRMLAMLGVKLQSAHARQHPNCYTII